MSSDEIHPIFHKTNSISSIEIMKWVDREPELLHAKSWGGWGDTLLQIAAHNGQLDLVQFLLKKGADPNVEKNWSALCKSATKEIAKLLLDHGAKLTLEYPKDLLFWACRYNRPEVLNFLIEQGKQINLDFFSNEFGKSVVHWAAEYPDDDEREDSSCLRILIKHGADINVATYGNDSTPLNLAAGTGSVSRFELLMSLGGRYNRSRLYWNAKENVKKYIEEKYPELALAEWPMSAEEISGQDLLVYSFHYVPTQAGFLSMASQMKFILWHVEDGMLQSSRGIQLRRFEIKNISVSVDGSHFVLPDEAGRVQIRSTSTLERIGFYQFPSESFIWYVQFSPCGNYLLAVPWNQQVIHILNLKTQAITTSLSHFSCQPMSFSFAANPRLFSFLTMEQGGAESGIFRIEPDGTAVLLEVYTGVEDGTSKIIFHPTLPVFMVNGKVYVYDDDEYLEMEPLKSDWWEKKHRFRAALKWRFDMEKLPKGSRYYFFKKYLLILSPQKLTYYTLGTGKIAAEHHFDLADGESIRQHLIEINKILLNSAEGFKLIDNPIQI